MKRTNSVVLKSGVLLTLVLLALALAGQAFGEGDDEGGGTIVFTKPVMAVVFEHKFHLEQGLECGSCHDDSGLFEYEAGNAENNEDFTMESLYQGKYCGACHDGDMAFASNTRCTVCHIGVKGYNRMQGKDSSAGGGHGE